jgi:hypothetical protein
MKGSTLKDLMSPPLSILSILFILSILVHPALPRRSYLPRGESP